MFVFCLLNFVFAENRLRGKQQVLTQNDFAKYCDAADDVGNTMYYSSAKGGCVTAPITLATCTGSEWVSTECNGVDDCNTGLKYWTCTDDKDQHFYYFNYCAFQGQYLVIGADDNYCVQGPNDISYKSGALPTLPMTLPFTKASASALSAFVGDTATFSAISPFLFFAAAYPAGSSNIYICTETAQLFLSTACDTTCAMDKLPGYCYAATIISSDSGCPAGYTAGTISADSTQCVPCPNGWYCPGGTTPTGTVNDWISLNSGLSSFNEYPCPAGYYCTTPASKSACPEGTTSAIGSISADDCV